MINKANIDYTFSNKTKIFIIDSIKFTSREFDVMSCIVSGRNTKSTAFFLSILGKQISERSVETHIANIRRKIKSSSRSGIVSFLEERPQSYTILREHYVLLRQQVEVDKLLTAKFSEYFVQNKKKILIIFNEKDSKAQSIADLLVIHLSKFLNVVDIFTFSDSEYENLLDIHNYDYVVLISLELHNHNITETLNLHKIAKGKSFDYTVVAHENLKDTLASKIRFISLSANYKNYSAFFLILAEIFNKPDITTFYQHIENLQQSQGDIKPYTIRFTRYYLIKHIKYLIPILIIFALLLFYLINSHSHIILRYDTHLPPSYMMVDREYVQQNIQEALDRQLYNKSIAIIGPSGSGKKVVARLHALKQTDADIIWEIDAKDTKSIKKSFEQLCFVLSKSIEDKKWLRGLNIVPSIEERERMIMNFIKKKLLESRGWVLIYNNVTQNHELNKYYPIDPQNWGKGKYIITTQDSNFLKTHLANSALTIPPLKEDEKIKLFTKILQKSESKLKNVNIGDEIKSYLKDVPPYPLDVQIAGYYLSVTNKFFKASKEDFDYFNLSKQKLYNELALENFGVQIRDKIIFATLDKVLAKNPRLIDLLFLVSILSNRNIPRTFLDTYSKDISYDYFIYELNKYSLFEVDIDEQYIRFSFHPTVQAIIRDYCLSKMHSTEISACFSRIYEAFYGLTKILVGANHIILKDIIAHCDTVLQYKYIINPNIYAKFVGKIGVLYLQIKDFTNAQKFLEQALMLIKQSDHNNQDLAQVQTALGQVYESFGDYDKSLKMLNESIKLQKMTKNYDAAFFAQTKLLLGLVELELGRYSKSKQTIEQILTSKEDLGDKKNWVHARAKNLLCAVQRVLGEYEEANALCNQSLAIFKKYFPNEEIASSQVELQMGIIKLATNNVHDAELIFNKINKVYNKFYQPSHPIFDLLLINTGVLYKNMGDIHTAVEFLTRASDNLKKNLRQNNLRVGWVTNLLTEIAISNSRISEATQLADEAEQIYIKYQHPSYHYTLLNKTRLLRMKYAALKDSDKLHAQPIYKQKINKLLEQAKEIIITTYPDNEKRQTLLLQLYDSSS